MITKVSENMPEISFNCKANGCNRKFKLKEKLEEHEKRRHNEDEEKN